MNNKIEGLKIEFNKLYDYLLLSDYCETKQAKRMVYKIIVALNNVTDYDDTTLNDLLQEIKDRFSKLFFPKSGLSEFYIWDDDCDKRIELAKQFEKIINNIYQLLA